MLSLWKVQINTERIALEHSLSANINPRDSLLPCTFHSTYLSVAYLEASKPVQSCYTMGVGGGPFAGNQCTF